MPTVTLQPPRMGPAVKFLLISIVVVLVVQASFTKFAEPLEPLFGFTPEDFLHGRFWQIFTYPFLHADLLHAGLNALFIYMLGAEFERRWGTAKFLQYYFICAIGGAIVQLIVWFASFFLFPSIADFLGKTPIIGASGAIYGLLIAFGLIFGDTYILLFFVLQVKAKHFVAGVAFVALFSAVFYTDPRLGGGVAHLVHLGGMVTGGLYLWWKGPNLTGGGGRGGKRRMSSDEVRRRLSLVVNNDEEKSVGDKGMPITWN